MRPSEGAITSSRGRHVEASHSAATKLERVSAIAAPHAHDSRADARAGKTIGPQRYPSMRTPCRPATLDRASL